MNSSRVDGLKQPRVPEAEAPHRGLQGRPGPGRDAEHVNGETVEAGRCQGHRGSVHDGHGRPGGGGRGAGALSKAEPIAGQASAVERKQEFAVVLLRRRTRCEALLVSVRPRVGTRGPIAYLVMQDC